METQVDQSSIEIEMYQWLSNWVGFPDDSDGKESACNAGDRGLIPGSGRSPGEGTSYPLQYPCLENPRDRETGLATAYGVAELDEWISAHAWSDWVPSRVAQLDPKILC